MFDHPVQRASITAIEFAVRKQVKDLENAEKDDEELQLALMKTREAIKREETQHLSTDKRKVVKIIRFRMKIYSLFISSNFDGIILVDNHFFDRICLTLSIHRIIIYIFLQLKNSIIRSDKNILE